MKDKVIFVNSHPIQYFAPMYKRLNELGVPTSCWYCSEGSLKGSFDQEFGVQIKWDVPLLEGYESRFFKNSSQKSPEDGFFSMINMSLLRAMFKEPKSVFVVHGWHYFTLFFVLMLGKLCGHTVCLRCEMPLSQEQLKTGFKQKIKNFGLKYLLFPRIDYFLYIGTQNRLFYKSFGIPDRQLLFCPYSVDNRRFTREAQALLPDKAQLRQQHGIPVAAKVLVFSAKYIEKKRPLDVLHAFAKLNNPNLWLILVGEGELRPEMEAFIAANSLQNVVLTGFVNQSKIPEYYAIGDVFVLCSGLGETWGLSVNEAMNFDLPLVLSDLSGCSGDLVQPGSNGYTFRVGDVDDLAQKLRQVLLDHDLTETVSSASIVREYSYDTVAKSLGTLVKPTVNQPVAQ
jgi:glycosyltransferase involved in cell wall biosynthesis